VIVCPRCSKENQDHYKFCLGCGGELPREKEPKSFTAPTPPSGVPAVQQPAPGSQPRAARGSDAPPQFGGAAAASAPEPFVSRQPAAPAANPTCPSCGAEVPPNFKFCGACGHSMVVPAAAPAPAPAPAAPPVAAPSVGAGPGSGMLVLIQPDGSEGGGFPLDGTTQVGRNAGGPFAADAYLSPVHATFSFHSGELRVTDEDSLNGVYIRVPRDVPQELVDGAIFRIGQELVRFEAMGQGTDSADGAVPMGSPNPGYLGRIRLITGRTTYGNSYCVPPEGMHLGRERGDVIFPDDGYVSGLHCRIHGADGRVFLTDVGSSNGTFVRIRGSEAIAPGTLLLLGQQLFRADY